MKHIKYPSIEQFRTIVQNVRSHASYIGKDEVTGDAIYDPTRKMPKLTFEGTVKLHGTHADVSINKKDGLWAQSRENIITPTKDNAAFAFFVESNKEVFNKIFIEVIECFDLAYDFDVENITITICGEWAGGNIQKGVGISNLEKSFFIFGLKITPADETRPAYWIDASGFRSTENRIYNIYDYQKYYVTIDFAYPEFVQNLLRDLTLSVEEQCPVALAFGHTGIGEGIVWTCNYNDQVYRFKTKGEKHSASKVKTIASVDVEKVSGIRDFVEYACTDNRFNQALSIIFPNNEPVDVKKLGDVIRWVVADITKEEMDTMVQNKLEPKDINKYISAKVREQFFNHLSL